MVAKKDKKGGTAAVVVDKLERHPLSEKYGPKLTAEEQLGLGLDMKANGQYEEIVLYEGKVLAGWNRYMGGLQQGMQKELKFKQLPDGMDPVAVAFGTNFIRRKLSSVQKAFYGARYAIDTGKKQSDVAKLMGCNLNRLNQSVQLLKAGTDAAKTAIEQIESNPDMSGGEFDEVMIEAGIAREAAPPPTPSRTNTHVDDDDPLGEGGGEDDLTGGAIDDLVDGEPDPDELVTPGSRKPRPAIGEGADPIPAVGKKPGSQTNPHETPVSRVGKAFKSLSAEEQRQFVKFQWAKLKAALDAAIKKGDVEYVAPERDAGPPDPSILARNKKNDAADDTLDTKADKKAKGKAKEEPKAAAKKTPAKKAAAKKGAKK